MAPLILKGETLGQKHRYYNELLKETISNGTSEDTPKLNYDEPDIDNLFKIDIASSRKNVEYILEVLKCEDMLYVSRALKQSVWLITDEAYAHIINPTHLHAVLLPQMTIKAGNKFLLRIRLNLKNETRVEDFYKYYAETGQLKTAFKWLPNCSLPFIETVVKIHGNKIPLNLVVRLCEKSFTVFEIYAEQKNEWNMQRLISECDFFLKNYAEKFLEIVDAQERYRIPRFSPKSTRLIMKTCPDMILQNFDKYKKKIHVPTFTKFIKREDVKLFVIEHIGNRHLKPWFTFETMKHFINRMPVEGRFDFIKHVWIEKSEDIFDNLKDDNGYKDLQLCAAPSLPQSSNACIYKWYVFAPFDTAFKDLKKIIQLESSPMERNAMLVVLVKCARHDLQNIQTLLQYYRTKHINESFKFKSHFVNIVLSHSEPYRFDEETWSILNEIFRSMEVYSDSKNNVQSCLKHIITYNIVHNTTVSEIIENKFEFDTLKCFRTKLNEVEKEKIFNYLYQFLITKINSSVVTKESDFIQLKTLIINVLNLLIDWDKNILDYVTVLEKIRELMKLKTEKYNTEKLSDIYNIKKSWRRHMFKESLSLNPTEETLVNALKHGPQILAVSIENMSLHDFISSPQFLKKIRTYWPQSLAKDARDFFFSQFNNIVQIKNSIRGLCILLPQKQFINIICERKPNCCQINWGEVDEITFRIQKYLAKYMYLARPQPNVDLVLLYAKEDYLQYALPSLHSIFFNMSINRSLEHLKKILKSPVSLQKHVLKVAFTKLSADELLKISVSTWNSTKNASIRVTVFKLVFSLLCKERNESCIKEIWQVFTTFIDSITSDENKCIYELLGKAENVPLLVRQEYYIKSYKCLKSMPPKTNCDDIIHSLIFSNLDLMESLDDELVADIIFDSFDKEITQQYYANGRVISARLLSTKSEATQTFRYERVFWPFITKCLTLIINPGDTQIPVKYHFRKALNQLLNDVKYIVIQKDMITPSKLFNDIHRDLEQLLSVEDNYILILTWKLAAEYMKIIDKCKSIVKREECAEKKSNEQEWDNINLEASPVFGEFVLGLLREHTKKYFPSIYNLFSEALTEIFNIFQFTNDALLANLKTIATKADLVEGHLLVLQMVPRYLNDNNEKTERSEILKIFTSHPSAEVRMHYQHKLSKWHLD